MADASCIGARAAISIAAATATMEDILLGLPFILVLYFMFGNVLLVLVCLVCWRFGLRAGSGETS